MAVFAAAVGAAAVWFGMQTGPASATAATISASCNASGALTERGSSLLSGPLKSAIATTPVAVSLPADATATPSVNPGGTITYKVVLQVSLQQLATDTLTTQVKPAIHDGALGSGLTESQATALANSAALNLRVSGLTGTLPVPNRTHLVGTPTAVVSAGGPSVSASAAGGGVSYSLGPIVANARQATSVTTTTVADTPTFSVTLSFKAQADSAVAGDAITLHPGPLAFAFAGPGGGVGGLNVSVNFSGSPIAGGVDGPEGCRSSDSVLATTAVGRVAGSTTAGGSGPSSTTVAGTGPSSARATAVRTYAPTLYLAPDETAFPSTVDHFLKHACLKYHYVHLSGASHQQSNAPVLAGTKPACGAVLAANAGRLGAASANPFSHATVRGNHFSGPAVTAKELTRPYAPGRSSKLTDPAEGFVLDETTSGYAGPATWATSTPAYYTTGNLARGDWYARFFFFYGVNRDALDPHEGDWESVAIRFTSRNVPTRIAYWQHACTADANHRTLDVAWSQSAMDGGTHPKVLVARGSHTDYRWSASGTPATSQVVCGHPELREPTSTRGAAFRPWASGRGGTAQIDGDTAPWYGFGGAWGQFSDTRGGAESPLLGAVQTGPVGPSKWLAGPPPLWR